MSSKFCRRLFQCMFKKSMPVGHAWVYAFGQEYSSPVSSFFKIQFVILPIFPIHVSPLSLHLNYCFPSSSFTPGKPEEQPIWNRFSSKNITFQFGDQLNLLISAKSGTIQHMPRYNRLRKRRPDFIDLLWCITYI